MPTRKNASSHHHANVSTAITIADAQDAGAGKLISLRQAGELQIWPDKGAGPTRSFFSLLRYTQNGTRSRGGAVVKLRAQRFAGGWFTCRLWVEEFLESLDSGSADPTVPTPAAIGRAHQRAEKALASAGL